MSKMQKKPKKGAPSWMVSFCDLMQLLLTFFIMLYSTSSTDTIKLQAFLDSFSGQKGILEQSDATAIIDLDSKHMGEAQKEDSDKKGEFDPSAKKIEDLKNELDNKMEALNSKEAQILEHELKEKLQEQGYDTKNVDETIEIVSSSEGVLVRFKDGVLFEPGKVEVKSDGQEILKTLGGILDKEQELKIEGHTDDVPVGNGPHKSNWELSTARAISVMNFLTTNKFIPESRCSVTGYSEFKPLAKNDTPENKSLNRRVDILIVNP